MLMSILIYIYQKSSVAMLMYIYQNPCAKIRYHAHSALSVQLGTHRDTFAFITHELALTKVSGTTRQHQRIQTCADCNAARVLSFSHKAASSN
jgi:hypothetical protein